MISLRQGLRAATAASRTVSRSVSSVPTTVRTAAIAAPAQHVQRRSYHEKVLDHYSRPRNPGSLDRSDPSVGTGLVGAPACGDVMKLQIRVDEATGKIVEARFKTFGCGSAIASSSYLTELVQGMSLEDASKIRNVDISRELCLPPVKLHCSMLAEDAIKAAIANYHTKNPRAATNLGGTAKTVEKQAAAAT